MPKYCHVNRAEKKLYDLWLTFLTQINEGEGTVPAVLLEEEIIREAVQYLERSSYSKDELDAYDRYWDAIRTERMYILDAEEKGRAEGLAEGEAIGLEKGLRNVVLDAHRTGFSLAQIQTITKLSKEKIEEILLPPVHQ